MTVSTASFNYVADLVRDRSAIQITLDKEYLVASRLAPLARDRGLTGPGAMDTYISLLRTDREEQDKVVEALTTNETSWFRDTSPFKALSETVLAEQPPGRAMRVWSAACSTGQEPYSIAMTLLEAGWRNFSITATDLSGKVLEQARAGTYSQLEMNRGLPAPMLVRYFTRVGATWQVSADLKRYVTFQQHNLLSAPPPGPFDVVFLRNVLIYFDTATKRDILAKVRQVMRPGGFLLLGAAETTVGIDDSWQRVDSHRTSLYRAPGGSQ